jgi:membrane peptidoglycan carboxypeptidase
MKTRHPNRKTTRYESGAKSPPPGAKKGKAKGNGGGKGAPKRRFRLLRWLFITSLFVGILGLCTLLGGYLYFASGLPDYRSLEDYRPPQVSRILAADGSLLGEIYHQRRTLVQRDQIPDVLVQGRRDGKGSNSEKQIG